MPNLTYETALIVGAGSGLSASLARLLSRQGMRVADAMMTCVKQVDDGAFNDQPEVEAHLRLTIARILNGNARSGKALPIAEQEKVIGRTKETSIELAEEVSGPESHVSRTTIEEHGVEQHIFRRNTPFGMATEHGTMFIG